MQDQDLVKILSDIHAIAQAKKTTRMDIISKIWAMAQNDAERMQKECRKGLQKDVRKRRSKA